MKVIGLEDKSIQYVLFRLRGKVSISFPQDFRSSDVLICQTLDSYKEASFQIHKLNLEYKVVIFLDYIKVLDTVSGIQILKELPDSFINYIKEKCTVKVPKIRFLKDETVEKKIEEIEKGSFFTRVIYPLLYMGLKLPSAALKKEITKSIAKSILECPLKKEPEIVKYKNDIRPKYFKQFIKWLETNEAKKVCECLLTREIKYNFDAFEINYLINNLDGE